MKKRISGIRFVLIFLTLSGISHAQLTITEVMSQNQRSVKDEDGDRSDWFEIYNNGSSAVDLGGFAVTDVMDQPLKWRLPERELEPNEFVVVFASGKDRRSATGEIHTDFKLNSDGEYLAISNVSTGKSIHAFAPTFPAVGKDQSCGLRFEDNKPENNKPTSDSAKNVVAFDEPTPGAPNEKPALPRVAAIRFSVPHGFLDKPTKVALTTETPGATIRYTVDGSEPTPEQGKIYGNPLTITTTTVLRAYASKDGHRATDSRTATYVYPQHVVHQPAEPVGWPTHYQPKEWWGFRRGRRKPPTDDGSGMKVDYAMSPPKNIDATPDQVADALHAVPTLSIVTAPKNFFGKEEGIFQNSERRGRESERPASVELIDPTGRELGFQVNAGVRIRGGHSRDHRCQKHSMRLYFRSEYGSGKLCYPLFGDEGVGEFDDIDLRTAQNYSYHMSGEGDQNTMIREVFSRDSQAALGQPYTRSRYYHVYINGLYWGLYQTQEHAEAAYASHYFGGKQSEYDAVKSRAGHGGLPTDGTADGWQTLWEMSGRIAAADSEAERKRLYNEIRGMDADGTPNPKLPVYLDADNLIDYMLVIFLTGNFDGPITNFAQNRASNNWFSIWKRGGQDGFQFFCHDSEHTLGGQRPMAWINRVGPFPAGQDLRQSNPQWIHQQLLAVSEYRMRFQERAAQSLLHDGPLSLKQNLIRLRHRAQEVDRVMLAEIARWGDTNNRRGWRKSHWDDAVKRIEGVLKLRANLVPRQLAEAKRYEKGTPRGPLVAAPMIQPVWAPEFRQRPDTDDKFYLPEAEGEENQAAIYYTTNGSDPRGEDGDPHESAKIAKRDSHTSTSFLGKESPIHVHVPKDDSLGRDWVAADFDDSDWMKGRGGCGYDLGDDYRKLIGVDVQKQMHEKQTTAYARYTFDVEKIAEFDRLVLRINFEDGFAGYLNGTLIAQRNAPRNPVWDSRATGYFGDQEALHGISVDVTEHKSLLRKGKNVLAFQMMNEQAGSTDVLLFARLELVADTEGTTVQAESGKPILARALRDGQWSLPFSTEAPSPTKLATAENLLVSEIMYHPAEPSDGEVEAGFTEKNDFEFLELVNVSEQTLDLSGIYCREGLHFLMTESTAVEAGGRVVLAANPAAFELRYGKKPDGRFLGQLANDGEAITIRNAGGDVLASLNYADEAPWPKQADGKGHSLVLKNEAEVPSGDELGDPDHWTASNQAGGTPGS